jgi:hypothetical protein
MMGSVLPWTSDRELEVAVGGGDALDVVEVLHNNRVVHRWYPDTSQSEGRYKVFVELGWGEELTSTAWTVDLEVTQGRLVEIEPRLRGHGIEPPPDDMQQRFAFSHVDQPGVQRVHWTTMTWRNPTVTTPATQGLCLTVEGDAHTKISGTINNQAIALTVGDLLQGAHTQYLGGFVSPAICFHQAVPRTAYAGRFAFSHTGQARSHEWYYVRVRQRNGHYAWSSPIWVTP